MKKLVSILVCLLTSSVAVAAQLGWGSDSDTSKVIGFSPNGGSMKDYVAYLCVGDATLASSTAEALASGAWSPSAAIATKNLTSFTADDGTEGGYIDGAYVATDIPGLGIDSHNFYIVILDATGEYYMVSSVLTGNPRDPNDPDTGTKPADNLAWSIDAMDDLSGNSGWMKVEPVPEASMALSCIATLMLTFLRRRKHM